MPLLECSLHWFSFDTTMEVSDLLDMLAHLFCGALGPEGDPVWAEVESSPYGHTHRFESAFGVSVHCTPGRDVSRVVLPGRACEVLGTARLLSLYDLLPSIRLRRFDLAVDGLTGPDGGPLDPEYLYKLCRDEPARVRSRVNFNGVDRDGLPYNNLAFHCNRQGSTVDLGSRQSDRFMRVYNRRGETRMELEVKGDTAERLGVLFDGASVAAVPFLALGLIRNFVDFVEPGKNKSRAALSPWWAAIVQDVEKIVVKAAKEPESFGRSLRWVLDGGPVATLNMLLEASGGDLDAFAAWLMAEGAIRQNARHRRLLHEVEREGGWRPVVGQSPGR